MTEYKLHYFNLRGKAELVRLVFAAAGQEYQDIRYNPMPPMSADPAIKLDWNDEAKATMPLGQMPVLEVDGQKFCQQSAIARFLAKRFGLMGDGELQEFKVDMVVETMWPDVAGKVTKIFYEKEEDKKAVLKQQAAEALPKMLEKIEKWVEGDFVLGDKLSLADLAIFDVMGFIPFFLPDLEVPSVIQKIIDNVKNHPQVKKWLESRPQTAF